MVAMVKNAVRGISVLFCSIFAPALLCAPAWGADLKAGEKIYERTCSHCHGMDGTGNAKMAATLKVDREKINLTKGKASHMTAYEIEALVDAGNHPMPPYRGKLDDLEIHNVAKYVKTFIAYRKLNIAQPKK